MLTELEQKRLTSFRNGAKDIQSDFEDIIDILDAGCNIPPAVAIIKKKVIKVLSFAKEILGSDALTDLAKPFIKVAALLSQDLESIPDQKLPLRSLSAERK